MLATSPTRLARRAIPMLLGIFYGCSDPSAPTAPRVAPRVHALAAPVVTVTNTDDAGAGSLRQAIIDAADGSVIQFAAGVAGKTIVLSTGPLNTAKQLTIEGPVPAGITISGGLQSGVFGVNAGGDLTLRNLSVVNGRNGFGGGISVIGKLALDHALVANNEAVVGGGGIGTGDDAIVTVVNSTISGNTAGSQGGGIYTTGELSIRNSTIANNTAQYGGGVAVTGGPLTVRNSIIASNVISTGIAIEVNCSISSTVVVTFSGSNLVDEWSCGTVPSIIQENPKLKPLADNGGPTKTHAIDLTSKAVDGGTFCSEATDQRYVTRNQGASCDIGAFEFNDYGTFTFTIGPNISVNPKTGVATVTGTVACSKLGSAGALVTLSQTQRMLGRFTTIVEGTNTFGVASCTTTPSSWSATVTPNSGKFENGAATAAVTTYVYPVGFLQGNASASVKVFMVK